MKTKKTFQILIALLSVYFLFVGTTSAQTLDSYDEGVKRPGDIGVKDSDKFKNSSFDTYFNVCKLDVNLAKVEENLLKYKEDKDNMDLKSLKNDVKALNEIKEAVPGLKNELKQLKGQGETMVKNAKNVKPKMKAPKAVKNTKKSVEVLDKANERMGILVERQKTALKMAQELMGEDE